MKIQDKLRKFMYGRYGPDELYNFLFKLYILLSIIDLFINSKILYIIELLIVMIMFYRFFSKKIYTRSKENQIFIKYKKKVLKPFINMRRNFKDKNNVYKKCKYCKKTLKLPLPDKMGIKHVKCPNCHKKINVLVLKKQTIKIIKGSA